MLGVETDGPSLAAKILFGVLAVWILAGAAFTMTRKNPVAAVMSLVGTFCGIAVLYASLSAHFLAIIQVLVYAGAIMVLFIFVVMILNRDEVTPVTFRGISSRLGGVAALGYLAVCVALLARSGLGDLPEPGAFPPDGFGTAAATGDLLFREFLFPFEAVSLLLLVAVVGGVLLSRSSRQEKEADDAAEQRAVVDTLRGDDHDGGGRDAAPDAASAGGHH